MEKYYHITAKKNLNSINILGVKPGYRKGITCNRPKHKEVFLTNDPARIITTQAGEKWTIKNDLVVMEINVDNLNIKPLEYHSGGTYTLSDYEFTTDYIPPNNIKNILNWNHFITKF